MSPGDPMPEDLGFAATNPLIDLVIRNAPVVLFATDAEGIMTLSRGRALDAMGLAQNELIGRSVFDLYTDEPLVADASRRALNGEAVTVPLDLNGVVHETMFAPIHDASGRVVGLVGVATDVTERVRAEEQIRRGLMFGCLDGPPEPSALCPAGRGRDRGRNATAHVRRRHRRAAGAVPRRGRGAGP